MAPWPCPSLAHGGRQELPAAGMGPQAAVVRGTGEGDEGSPVCKINFSIPAMSGMDKDRLLRTKSRLSALRGMQVLWELLLSPAALQEQLRAPCTHGV